MVRYLNPDGRNWGPENLDGYGISFIVVIVLYSLLFYAASAFLWMHRHHPVVRMRKINLALLSILILHVYLFMVFMLYTLNGSYPCSVEFWVMSLYLPIGIGLFQAQNQQLLIVSTDQDRLLHMHDLYKPMIAPRGKGLGGPRYWLYRFKIWWNSTSKQGKYEGFVFAGIVIQFLVSMIIYTISRKFNGYGVVSRETSSPAQCRRGWEWLPSIAWQFLWNFFFGPYLLWKIRLIRDVYNWRLQTILAIVAGLPGTPLWLAALYSDNFNAINKYWVPAMWFAPGLVTMELVTLVFPILAILKHKRAIKETNRILADFDAKRLHSTDGAMASSSVLTRSTGSKRGKMYSMETLDECLNTNYDGLQIYASCIELNGENIMFLAKVLKFQKSWQMALSKSNDFSRARMVMFRAALGMFVSLVHADTASYPINIESPIYAKLESVFGKATALVATTRPDSKSSTPISMVTPWDDHIGSTRIDSNSESTGDYPMKPVMASPPTRVSTNNDSSEHIISLDDPADPEDRLADFAIPTAFDEHVFEAAFKSIKYMVWTETWQRYMQWKRTSTNGVE